MVAVAAVSFSLADGAPGAMAASASFAVLALRRRLDEALAGRHSLHLPPRLPLRRTMQYLSPSLSLAHARTFAEIEVKKKESLKNSRKRPSNPRPSCIINNWNPAWSTLQHPNCSLYPCRPSSAPSSNARGRAVLPPPKSKKLRTLQRSEWAPEPMTTVERYVY